ncbi:MAG TPA: hypothetical protein VFX68_06870 [Sulfuricurvum sp.]|nr:hypothetical protein [Sulfuricurvum sp.]
MLLYNHKQEFIGIDEEGLRLLNYASLHELLSVCTDVADLFANEPGYIHNFKSFGWIDYLLHADSDASSAIVHANGRVFSCQLSVSPFYLCENPNQNSYSIEMNHVKTISGEDIKPHAISAKAAQQEYTPPLLAKVEESIITALPDYADLTPMQLDEPNILDVPEHSLSAFDDEIHEEYLEEKSPFKEETFEPSPFKEEIPVAEPVQAANKPQEKPIMKGTRYTADEQEYLDHHNVLRSYIYDPNVAANELGLPVDLIEEFIGDFIQQAYDFKDDLFASSAKNDFNNLHILSHKLKGVAANLRIDDAFETLSVINTSSEPVEIEANLKYFFDIIQKLKGGELLETEFESTMPETQKSPSAAETEASDDIYSFGLKQYEDEPLIVHEDELELSESSEPAAPKETVFKKELLDIHEPAPEIITPLEEEPFLEETPNTPESINQAANPKLEYNSFTVAKSLGIEPAFMDELLFDYKNDSRIISNQITSAIQAFDTTTWNESAAKLKGISDNLRLSEISEELTILSKTHDAQEAKKASLRLNAYLDQL